MGSHHGPQAVVLAGGLGLRLRPAVPDLPKVMAPLGGRPFLEHVLGELRAQGVRRAVLCLGYKAEEVAGYFGDGSRVGLRITYSVEGVPAGTGGALCLARRHLDPTFVLLNGDTLVRLDLGALLAYHRARGALVTAVGRRCRGRPRQDAGYMRVAGNGAAAAYFRGGSAGRGLSQGELWVDCGLYACQRRAVELFCRAPAIARDGAFSFESAVFGQLLGAVCVYPTTEQYLDIGSPERYRRLKREWEDTTHDLPQ
jgi:NDP-sugar pyrophosphorylase family protein